MPEVSERVKNLHQSPMRKLLPFADKAKSEGVHIYHLNIGQPDIKTPEPYFEALKSFDGAGGNMVDEYVVSQGLPELRKNFAKYTKLSVEGIDDLSEENCLITQGGSEALAFLAYTLFEPGDKIIIPEPYYANYNAFFGMNGVEITPVTTDINENFSLEGIVSKIRHLAETDDKIKGILITNPGNPTGAVYTEKELLEIAKIVKERNLWFISDEVYREIVFDGETPRSILSIKDIRDNAIVVDSVSKKWSACGARIGAVISFNKDVIFNLLKTLQTRLSASRVNQVAANAMIRADVEILEKRKEGISQEPTSVEMARDEYSRRRKASYDVLKGEGIVCGYPKGALYLLLSLGEAGGRKLSAEKFCRFLLEEFRDKNETVMVTPADDFYRTKEIGKNQVRLAFVLDEEKTKRATEIICKAIAAFKEKYAK